MAQPSLKLIDSGFVFQRAPFAACHASTLVDITPGFILAAWFGGKQEGSDDVSIWMAQRKDNIWSAPMEVANGQQKNGNKYPCWNPVLFNTKHGQLYLFYKVGPNPREWWGEVKSSADNGKSWSASKKLPEGFLGPIKNKPVQLPNGDLLFPSSVESIVGNKWSIHVERADKDLGHWTKTEIAVDTFDVIQPSILRYGNGSLQLLNRSRQNAIVETWSFDGGRSWSPLKKLPLPNPNAGSDAVTLKNGWQLLVYNPLLKGEDWWQGRSTLKIAISRDGRNWKDVFTLEQHQDGEYSYPAVIQDASGIIHVSYTYRRTHIKYARFMMK